MSTVILLLITGIGLGALYFLVASGLSLIYGLMHVLNFTHGPFLTLGGLLGWEAGRRVGDGTWPGLVVAMLVGIVVGALFAIVTELLFIRKLYNRHIEQVLVTVGLSLAAVALFEGIWGPAPIVTAKVGWLRQTTTVLGARIPNHIWLLIAAAVLYFLSEAGVKAFAFMLGLTTIMDLVVVIMFTHPIVSILANTRYFGEGRKWSGMEPERLGAKRSTYLGRGQFREPEPVGPRRRHTREELEGGVV